MDHYSIGNMLLLLSPVLLSLPVAGISFLFEPLDPEPWNRFSRKNPWITQRVPQNLMYGSAVSHRKAVGEFRSSYKALDGKECDGLEEVLLERGEGLLDFLPEEMRRLAGIDVGTEEVVTGSGGGAAYAVAGSGVQRDPSDLRECEIRCLFNAACEAWQWRNGTCFAGSPYPGRCFGDESYFPPRDLTKMVRYYAREDTGHLAVLKRREIETKFFDGVTAQDWTRDSSGVAAHFNTGRVFVPGRARFPCKCFTNVLYTERRI